MNARPRTASLLIVFLSFCLGAGSGAGVVLLLRWRTAPAPQREVHAGQTGLINPLLDIHEPENRNPSLSPFHREMEDLVARLTAECPDSQIAVYYSNLNDGSWIGIDENQRFFPASLVKVPIVIAAFKHAEKDPGFLGRETILPASEGSTPKAGTFLTLRGGVPYTNQKLIEESSIRSSNDAAWLLLNTIDERLLKATTDLIGRNDDPSRIFETSYRLSPVELGAFFRVLYNSTFLSREMSQKALEVFTLSDFNGGLVAGVPPGTLVANKYGEKPLVMQDRKMYALHDCGIIYHPRHPFLLCVMTTGCDPSSQALAIAAIARLAWEKTELLP